MRLGLQECCIVDWPTINDWPSLPCFQVVLSSDLQLLSVDTFNKWFPTFWRSPILASINDPISLAFPTHLGVLQHFLPSPHQIRRAVSPRFPFIPQKCDLSLNFAHPLSFLRDLPVDGFFALLANCSGHSIIQLQVVNLIVLIAGPSKLMLSKK